jgi:hypothetical protein
LRGPAVVDDEPADRAAALAVRVEKRIARARSFLSTSLW